MGQLPNYFFNNSIFLSFYNYKLFIQIINDIENKLKVRHKKLLTKLHNIVYRRHINDLFLVIYQLHYITFQEKILTVWHFVVLFT